MKEIDINTWLTLLGMLAAVVIFLFKGAAKVEKNDINLSHDVETNKAEIEKIDLRLTKIENTIIDKAVSDALLSQKVVHISETVDRISTTQSEIINKTLAIILEIQRKGGSL